MRRFTVTVNRRDFLPAVLPNELVLTPRRWAGAALGGMRTAEIEATGPRYALFELLDWLRYETLIYNRNGTAVWWGYVAALSLRVGAVEIGVSLDEVSNRIQVIYAYQDPDGKSIKGATGWSVDADSIAAYGTWELIKSLGNATAEQAAQDLAVTLAAQKWPVGTPVISSGRSGQPGATLFCRGWYDSLRATYYSRADGVERHAATGNARLVLGQQYTAATIGFEPNNDYIHDLSGNIRYFTSGAQVQVSGSAGNDGAFTVSRSTEQAPQSFAATTISFDPSDDVHTSTADGFAFIDANDLIHISGAAEAANNGYKWVKATSNSDSLTTIETTMVAEAAGALVTISRGNAIGIEGALTREAPGATVTLTTIGEKVAQRFTVSSAAGWTAYELWVRLGVIGAPADGITVELCADSSGAPGTVLGSTTSAVGSLPTALAWAKFTLSSPVTLTAGDPYWLVVRRSGASHHIDYYEIDSDEDAGYSGGSLLLWNGAAWVASASDLPFAVWGMEETTVQAATLIGNAGQFLRGGQILDASGLLTYQYRDGSLSALSELEALLAAGATDGRRLLATVTEQRYLQISKEPAAGDIIHTCQLSLDGKWLDSLGSPWEEGVLPVGKWVEIRDLPPEVANSTRITPFFVESAEFDADAGELRIEPRGAWSGRDSIGVRQG